MNEDKINEDASRAISRGSNNPHAGFSAMVLCGIGGMVGWVTMFSLGLLISSQSYRDAVGNHFNLSDFLMSVITFTPTNIAALCIIAAFSGGCASRLVFARIAKKRETDRDGSQGEKTDSDIYMTETPFSSMLRGLVVYFAFLAGVFVATSAPFANPTAQQYAQSAGVASLFSFIVGYDPTVFKSLLNLSGKIKLSDNS